MEKLKDPKQREIVAGAVGQLEGWAYYEGKQALAYEQTDSSKVKGHRTAQTNFQNLANSLKGLL